MLFDHGRNNDSGHLGGGGSRHDAQSGESGGRAWSLVGRGRCRPWSSSARVPHRPRLRDRTDAPCTRTAPRTPPAHHAALVPSVPAPHSVRGPPPGAGKHTLGARARLLGTPTGRRPRAPTAGGRTGRSPPRPSAPNTCSVHPDVARAHLQLTTQPSYRLFQHRTVCAGRRRVRGTYARARAPTGATDRGRRLRAGALVDPPPPTTKHLFRAPGRCPRTPPAHHAALVPSALAEVEARDVPVRCCCCAPAARRAAAWGQPGPFDVPGERRHVAAGERVGLRVLRPEVAGHEAARPSIPSPEQRVARRERLDGGDLRRGVAGGDDRLLLPHAAEGDVVGVRPAECGSRPRGPAPSSGRGACRARRRRAPSTGPRRAAGCAAPAPRRRAARRR